MNSVYLQHERVEAAQLCQLRSLLSLQTALFLPLFTKDRTSLHC